MGSLAAGPSINGAALTKLSENELARIIPAMRQEDIIRLWDEHTADEFVIRDAEATLATMTDDAYVNHIPVMTGGNGRAALLRFYSTHLIPVMPPDTTLTPVSRTVGEDQLVDEIIF